MRKIAALLTALALVLGLCACTAAQSTWQEQYDLGVRYLSEGNYREAIIAFNAAIEIDPKRADAYIGLADAYVAQGDMEQARQVLADALAVVSDPRAIQTRLDGLGESVAPGSTPGTTQTPNADHTQAAGTPEVTVTATGIRADSVFNTDGYGSLKINGNWDGYWEDEDEGTPAQLALIDRSGTLLFPYREDPIGNMFAGDAGFYYSDGVVSFTMGNAYYNGGIPQYFNLDRTPAFTLEETENEYTDDNGIHRSERTSYLGGPMKDGYAVVIQKLYSSWWGGWAGGVDSIGENTTLIVDKNGVITCELPQEFNEGTGWGAGGFGTKMSLGWCGEGLFAFVENNYDDDWNYTSEGKGYMDPTGKTVIDLEGRGFTNLGPFTNGLAWVVDETGKVGFIDKTGALVIPCIYESTGSFSSDGLTYAKMDGKWGYIDKTGKTVIPFEYDSAYGAGDGLAAVVKDGKCGLVDYNNNVVVPLEYDDISSFEGGVAYGIKDGLVYIINSR